VGDERVFTLEQLLRFLKQKELELWWICLSRCV